MIPSRIVLLLNDTVLYNNGILKQHHNDPKLHRQIQYQGNSIMVLENRLFVDTHAARFLQDKLYELDIRNTTENVYCSFKINDNMVEFKIPCNNESEMDTVKSYLTKMFKANFLFKGSEIMNGLNYVI